MKRALIKKALLTLGYVVFALLIELFTFLMLGFGGIAKYMVLDIACILVIAAVIFMIPNYLAETITALVILLAQCVLSVVNGILYNMSGYVATISMFSMVGEAVAAVNSNYLNFFFLFMAICCMGAAAFYYVLVLRNYKAGECTKAKTVAVACTIALITALGSVGAYALGKTFFVEADEDDQLYVLTDDSYLYETQRFTAKSYKAFGTFSFYYKNIENWLDTFFPADEEEEFSLEMLDEYFAEGENAQSLENLDLTQYGGNDSILTGALDGQNIVVIVIESGEWYGINDTYTPTLNALAEQGIVMTGNTTRDKTNHSEAMSILGSYPIETRNAMSELLGNSFTFSLPNIVRENGYTTNYFHAGQYEFYERNTQFDSGLYGFDHAYFGDMLNLMNGYYEKTDFYDFDRDSEIISQYLDEFTAVEGEDSLFYTQMMTLTSHGSYEDLIDYGNYSSDWTDEEKQTFEKVCTVKKLGTYYERITAYPEADAYVSGDYAVSLDEQDEEGEYTEVFLRYKRYQAGLMDLDVGVNRLLHELEESGELSDTAFVVYADHSSYYNNQNYILKDIEVGEAWNTDTYNIPFFIWSGKYMDLTVDTDLYEGLAYVKDDLEEEWMKEEGVSESDFYSGDFYYGISHSSCGNTFSWLSGMRIDKFCSSFDVLPTVLDLLGYDYNTNLYQGVSVFDAREQVFISREAGCFKKNIYTDLDKVYIKAEPNLYGGYSAADGSIRQVGEILFVDNSEGQTVHFTIEDAEDYLYLYEGEYDIYFVYEFDDLVYSTSEYGEYLSGSVYDFLAEVSAYYLKQDYLEEMYALDYFAYRDIGNYVSKIV